MHDQRLTSLCFDLAFQLCWFWLDEECSTLYWDLDEGEGSRADEAAGIGGSLPLERIDDIVPLGAGPDQVQQHRITLPKLKVGIVLKLLICFIAPVEHKPPDKLNL